MNETRICPVCENEIPEDASYYYCPYCFCFFDREKRNDDEAIESAKQNLDRVKNDKSISATGHLIAGFIGALVAQVVYFIVWPWGAIDMQCFAMPTFFLLSLPFGLLTGYLGYLLEKKLNRRLNMRFVYLILTFILSIVTSVLFLKLVLDKSYHP